MEDVPARNLYEVLEVEKTATPAEIRNAYRKLALRYHPDRQGGGEAEQMFKLINQANEILSDPARRRKYDTGATEAQAEEETTVSLENMGTMGKMFLGVFSKLGFHSNIEIPPSIRREASEGAPTASKFNLNSEAITVTTSGKEARVKFIKLVVPEECFQSDVCVRISSKSRGRIKLLYFINGELQHYEDAHETKEGCEAAMYFSHRDLFYLDTSPHRKTQLLATPHELKIFRQLEAFAPSTYRPLTPGEHLFAITEEIFFFSGSKMKFSANICSPLVADHIVEVESKLSTKKKELEAFEYEYKKLCEQAQEIQNKLAAAEAHLAGERKDVKTLLGSRDRAYETYAEPQRPSKHPLAVKTHPAAAASAQPPLKAGPPANKQETPEAAASASASAVAEGPGSSLNTVD